MSGRDSIISHYAVLCLTLSLCARLCVCIPLCMMVCFVHAESASRTALRIAGIVSVTGRGGGPGAGGGPAPAGPGGAAGRADPSPIAGGIRYRARRFDI
jgi:hypothetical protein